MALLSLCTRFLLSAVIVAVCGVLSGNVRPANATVGVIDGKGYSTKLKMPLTYWQCFDDATFLGKANNLVVDKELGFALCDFLNEKKAEFDSELEGWKEAFKKKYSKISWLNVFKKLYYKFTTTPKFSIQATVNYWHPLDTDNNGHPQPWISASFSYVLPKKSDDCYGYFESMVENFEYRNSRGRKHTDVVILISPVYDENNPNSSSYTLNLIAELFASNSAASHQLKPSSGIETFSAIISEYNADVNIAMSLADFWDYGRRCNVHDGRFYTDRYLFESGMDTSVCAWAQHLANESLLRMTADNLKTVSINVNSVDFFQNPRAVFCGSVTETFYHKRRYTHTTCFYVDNNPLNQQNYVNAMAARKVGKFVGAGKKLWDLYKTFKGEKRPSMRGGSGGLGESFQLTSPSFPSQPPSPPSSFVPPASQYETQPAYNPYANTPSEYEKQPAFNPYNDSPPAYEDPPPYSAYSPSAPEFDVPPPYSLNDPYPKN